MTKFYMIIFAPFVNVHRSKFKNNYGGMCKLFINDVLLKIIHEIDIISVFMCKKDVSALH